ncbi:MAG: DNA cytosine methyltransferase [Candidatus Marinimicrobia bacterium]|nr:DNA cytosine methyltransferase [Candidatus Neomarinimicrobiota bacterium]
MSGIIIDNFAGGGGASTGIEAAIGRPIDYAINHDPQAIAMHKANHPSTYHYCENVWDVDPRDVAGGRQVDLAWFSPDCKHFSRAKGGMPVEKNIRGLAWVAIRYAATVRPNVIFLENVQEFAEWGPLEGNKPDPNLKGQTFQNWKKELRKLGYQVEHRSLVAADFGAPTSRKRLFLVARLDQRPIVWPEETHGEGRLPYRTAAECIDWSIPCPSIFSRKKPLAENTLRRIARGLQKFVIDAADSFVMVSSHAGRGDARRNYPLDRPLTTIMGQPEHYLVTPYVIKHYTGATGSDIARPFPTIMGRNTQNQLLTAFLTRWFGKSVGCDVAAPAPSTTAGGGGKTGLVTSHLIKLRGTCRHGQDVREPMPTITGGGTHIGEVRAFLIKYYGTATGQSLREPAHSITSKARLGLVTIHGQDYQIADIGMRMLQPRELYLAQGFPDDYIIDPDFEGKPLTKTAQIKMCGNSVSPHPAEALVRANVGVG